MIASIVAALFVASVLPWLAASRFPFFSTILGAVLVDLANEDRAIASAQPLAPSPILEAAARMKAEDMAKNHYFAHTSPAGVTPWHWFRAAGYRYTYAGENLALNFTDSADVERAWMNSSKHRANILNMNFTEVGIAVATGTYQGRATTFVVQLFGRPDARSAAPGRRTPPPPNAARAPFPVAEPETETVAETESFAAVRVAGEETNTSLPSLQNQPERQATRLWRLFASPQGAVSWAYLALAALVSTALVFLLTIEVRHQHPRHAAYGVLLLILIAGAMWLAQIIAGGPIVS